MNDRIVTWPRLSASPGGWTRLAYAVTIEGQGRSHVVGETIWVAPPNAVLREGPVFRRGDNAAGPRVEMRASDGALMEFDVSRRHGTIRTGEGAEANYEAVIARLAGPAAAVYRSGGAGWVAAQVRGGTRYRSIEPDAPVREVVIDDRSGLPRLFVADGLRITWRLVAGPAKARPPEAPDISGWRLEAYEFDGSSAAAVVAPRSVGDAQLIATFAFRSGAMAAAHEYAIWETKGGRVTALWGASGKSRPPGEFVEAVDVAGERAVVTATSRDLLEQAVGTMREARGVRTEAVESRIASARSRRTESREQWAQRLRERVASMPTEGG